MARPRKVSDLCDLYAPPVSLLCKLASIAVHVDEATSDDAHHFDVAALRSLLADREVQDWLEAMGKEGLAPVKRNARST